MIGSKLRQEVGRIIDNIKASDYCSCFKPNFHDCTTCLRRQVAAMLCERGFTTNLCTSRWKTTNEFPGGAYI